MSRTPPVELTSFVGRRFELSQARRQLGSTRLLTVVGHGGVGKTRLAARLALQATRSFRDGIVWVELAAHRDPASIAGVVAGAAGVDPRDRPADEAVMDYLRSRELLLILDNCEHLVDACGRLVTSWLADAPRVRIVTTSRQPLRVAGEQLMDLEPLSLPTPDEVARGFLGHVEAVALLTDRAQAVDAGFRVDDANAELVSHLCQQLDGIPLAIELAAARLRVLSVGQLVDRLDKRFDVLNAGLRSAPPRHQTLRGLVEWSYDLCSPAEQALWAQLSAFDGGADIEAIEAVCEGPGSTMEVVAGLVDKSVLTTTQLGGGVRYRMLETIREYGAERLADRADADDVRRRHRDHYVSMARAGSAARFGHSHQQWPKRTLADIGNLRGAFEHSLTHQADRSAALDLITSLYWFWPFAGLMEEGARWTERALAGSLQDSPALLRALTAAAYLAGQRQDTDSLRSLAQRAANLRVIERTPAERAARHLVLGLLATVDGRHQESLAEHLKALDEYTAAGDVSKQVDELQNVALRLGFLGRAADALPYLDTALDICEEHGEQFERFWTLSVYGNILALLGRHKETVALLAESVAGVPPVRFMSITGIEELMARHRATVDDERRAAVLLGVRGRIFDDAGYRPGVYSRGGYAAMEHQLATTLGEAEFQAAYDEGFSMPPTSVVDVALGGEARSPERSGRALGQAVLSKRESEVAALVARGLSNREIARQLVISDRTAEGHVARIMDKLGVQSRVGIAAWAASNATGEDNG